MKRQDCGAHRYMPCRLKYNQTAASYHTYYCRIGSVTLTTLQFHTRRHRPSCETDNRRSLSCCRRSSRSALSPKFVVLNFLTSATRSFFWALNAASSASPRCFSNRSMSSSTFVCVFYVLDGAKINASRHKYSERGITVFHFFVSFCSSFFHRL